jgi:ribosomal protein S18 acetylase RimI-like enzyme
MAVLEIGRESAVWDVVPGAEDLRTYHSRDSDFFLVAVGSLGRLEGFACGTERRDAPAELLAKLKAHGLGSLGSLGSLEILAVARSSRRPGLGRALLNSLLRRLAARVIDLVTLAVPAEAKALDDDLGFAVRANSMLKRPPPEASSP